MKVFHVAFECAPIYKTGGLGDVVGSLPKAMSHISIDTAVIMPGYAWIKKLSHLPGSEVPVLYVESPYFKKENTIHNHKIQAPKYAHFCLQVLDLLKKEENPPDIIHCHDWHSALIPWLLKKLQDPFFLHTKSILTIHNGAYQGKFPTTYLKHRYVASILNLLDPKEHEINFLKLGIASADYVTTVSPHYAYEMKKGIHSFHLEKSIRRRKKFVGIINGIDYQVWNPHSDKVISHNYSARTVKGGKQVNKMQLQKQLHFAEDVNIPLFTFVSRLTSQKGIEFVISLIEKLPVLKAQLIILGTGQRDFELKLLKYKNDSLLKKYLAVTIDFDEKIAHRLYASADFFLIPSRFEPCGLTQMIAMAYGTIPIASAVGGLLDTVKNQKTGLVFKKMTDEAFLETITDAIQLWNDDDRYMAMVRRCMRQDFSWDKSAVKYKRLYERVVSL